VPTSPHVTRAPANDRTPLGKIDGKPFTEPPQIRLTRPLKQISTATVATIPTSGSEPSKRRISNRSVSPPMTSEASIVATTARPTGTPAETSDQAM
jgi:hypothetical protein